MTHTIMFLAGIGQDASAWQPVIDGLQGGWTGHSYAVSDLVAEDTPFTMAAAVGALHEQINRLQLGETILCGLSLGAMIAMSYAIAHPERTLGLVLTAPAVRPNPALMMAETVAVQLLPTSLLGLPSGLTKRRLREILNVVGRIDYRSSLAEIGIPTLVVCGGKDRVNLATATKLSEELDQARLATIEEAGHELNASHPVEFGHILADFLSCFNRNQGI